MTTSPPEAALAAADCVTLPGWDDGDERAPYPLLFQPGDVAAIGWDDHEVPGRRVGPGRGTPGFHDRAGGQKRAMMRGE